MKLVIDRSADTVEALNLEIGDLFGFTTSVYKEIIGPYVLISVHDINNCVQMHNIPGPWIGFGNKTICHGGGVAIKMHKLKVIR